MVIDSSVLIAILLDEPEAEGFRIRLAETQEIFISAISLVESAMVIEYKGGEPGAKNSMNCSKSSPRPLWRLIANKPNWPVPLGGNTVKAAIPQNSILAIVAVMPLPSISTSHYCLKVMIFLKPI
jgi:PIN domain